MRGRHDVWRNWAAVRPVGHPAYPVSDARRLLLPRSTGRPHRPRPVRPGHSRRASGKKPSARRRGRRRRRPPGPAPRPDRLRVPGEAANQPRAALSIQLDTADRNARRRPGTPGAAFGQQIARSAVAAALPTSRVAPLPSWSLFDRRTATVAGPSLRQLHVGPSEPGGLGTPEHCVPHDRDERHIHAPRAAADRATPPVRPPRPVRGRGQSRGSPPRPWP